MYRLYETWFKPGRQGSLRIKRPGSSATGRERVRLDESRIIFITFRFEHPVKMKKSDWIPLALAMGFLTCTVYAQEQPKAPKASVPEFKKSVLSHYESGLAPDRIQREALKAARMAWIRERRAILDTLELSPKKKNRLLRDLYEDPSSGAWDRLMARLESDQTVVTAEPE